jgi:threonine aldolase
MAGDMATTESTIDLRSDTITRPTREMRNAIAEAEVGDDVFGEDPTVNRLEARAAEILGKEAAVFVPSGTMSNQIAIRAHTEPGDEILLEAFSHLYYYEAGAPSALAGVSVRCLPGMRGIFTPEILDAAIRPSNLHFPPSRLLCLENTHNRGGGTVWPLAQMRAVTETACRHGIRVHLDGARLWNASVASGVPEREYAALADSVSVCFSKGLGAPIGSALAGPREFIARARRFRKQFGGAMRQGGIAAAGALYALEHHRDRLAEDHVNARRLAEALSRMPGVELDPAAVQTNIVMIRITSRPASAVVERLSSLGVRVLATAPDTIRAVTNLHVSSDDVDAVLARWRIALEET